jgi:hypothetical protein
MNPYEMLESIKNDGKTVDITITVPHYVNNSIELTGSVHNVDPKIVGGAILVQGLYNLLQSGDAQEVTIDLSNERVH